MEHTCNKLEKIMKKASKDLEAYEYTARRVPITEIQLGNINAAMRIANYLKSVEIYANLCNKDIL